LRICRALGVEPRTESTRAYLLFRGIERLARESIDTGAAKRDRSVLACTTAVTPMVSSGMSDEWRVKRDLMLYAILRFESNSLLQALDPGISTSRLIELGSRPEICSLEYLEADYAIRLFATIVAGHAWEKLSRGQWRGGRSDALRAAFEKPERSNDEKWWLRRRLWAWPSRYQRAGAELLGYPEGWTCLPPWPPCWYDCTLGTPSVRIAASAGSFRGSSRS
jgi:hypothetical protein